jgi:stage IV sporulation protein B
MDEQAIPTAAREQVRVGEAEILCTLSSGERCAYAVTLSAIDRDATGSKCFAIQVTDPRLIEQTGGIVQGMSGSPVIQDGKLVGAVTHVLVCDPTRGYGIFIENMLAAE